MRKPGPEESREESAEGQKRKEGSRSQKEPTPVNRKAATQEKQEERDSSTSSILPASCESGERHPQVAD